VEITIVNSNFDSKLGRCQKLIAVPFSQNDKKMADIPSIEKKLVKTIIASYNSPTPDIHYVRTNVTRIIFSEVLHNPNFVGLSGSEEIRGWFIHNAASKWNSMKSIAPHWFSIINQEAIEKLVDWDFISTNYAKCGYINDILECNDQCTSCMDYRELQKSKSSLSENDSK